MEEVDPRAAAAPAPSFIAGLAISLLHKQTEFPCLLVHGVIVRAFEVRDTMGEQRLERERLLLTLRSMASTESGTCLLSQTKYMWSSVYSMSSRNTSTGISSSLLHGPNTVGAGVVPAALVVVECPEHRECRPTGQSGLLAENIGGRSLKDEISRIPVSESSAGGRLETGTTNVGPRLGAHGVEDTDD